jgi:hypothetical protein
VALVVGGSSPLAHPKFMSPSSRRTRTLAFHAGNRGSNPLGDANAILVRAGICP